MKSDRIEDVLVQCIEDIKANRSSLDECLEMYPHLRERLEPLLRIALDIREPPNLKPSPHFKTEARVWLMNEISLEQSAGKRLWSRFSSQLRPMLAISRFSMAGVAIAVVLALSAAGWGVAYASQDSLPGDTLYGLKLFTEQVRMTTPGDDTARAERALRFADIRIGEMEALAGKSRPDDLGRPANRYGDAMDTVHARLERAAAAGFSTGNLTASVAEATSRHISVLDVIYDMVPDQAKPAVAHARNSSQIGHLRALRALAQDQPERAIEINLAAVEERLIRARNAAQAHDDDEMADALGRFEEMSDIGALIAARARQLGVGDGSAVSVLLARATSRQLLIIDEIADMSPGAALQAVVWMSYEVVNRYRQGLMDLSEMDPVKATQINLKAMDERLDRIRAMCGDSQAVEIALEHFDAMAQLGEEISRIAQQADYDADRINQLLAEATSMHVEVLADVWEMVPEPSREPLERALARALIRQENRIPAMEQGGAELPDHQVIPPDIRERVNVRMREQRIWDEGEAMLSPGTPGGTTGCPGCIGP